MNDDRRAILEELYAESRAHDERQADRLARFRNVEPPTAELLAVLVRSANARRVLEIGTSNGYSTIWLADGVEATGGRLVSLEIDPARTALARGNLGRAGLSAVADLRTQDAGEALRSFADAEWDLIFLDAERPAYVAYWPDLVRVLAPGGLLVVDNVISHAHELVEFDALVRSDPRFVVALVPVGAGALLAVKASELAVRA
jgi:predicted O-methyltransferase YrrM